jgi:hypothetical protein
MNGKVACTKILRCADEVLIIDLGTYLDKGKYKWFNKTKVLSICMSFMMTHSSLAGGPKKRTEISKYYYCFCSVSLTNRDESCSKL